MGKWRGFLDSLDTDGGHLAQLHWLILVGFIVFIFDPTAGGTIVTGSFGALLMGLKSKGTNSEQVARGGKPFEPPQPPPTSLTPPLVVGEGIPSTTASVTEVTSTTKSTQP